MKQQLIKEAIFLTKLKDDYACQKPHAKSPSDERRIWRPAQEGESDDFVTIEKQNHRQRPTFK